MSKRPKIEATPYRYGFRDPEQYVYKSGKGLSRQVVEGISAMKDEPSWMLELRLKALDIFFEKPMPTWGGDLSAIDFDDIYYYVRPTEGPERNWEDVPEHIKRTFDRLGVPEAERKYLAGVGAQYESEVVYHHLKEEIEKQGVIFTDMDTAVKEYPDIVQRHFGTVVPAADNKFAALNAACWSGGVFLYVPEGVRLNIPLQGYYRLNASNIGQFERTLVVAEPGSSVHYLEGCSAPIYSTDMLHTAVAEVVAKPEARVQWTTVQNWSTNVYNVGTKRAVAYDDANVFWLDCNTGSKLTMKYPGVYLMGPKARAEILSVSLAGAGQHQDNGGRIIHAAPETSSTINSKSISMGGGRTSYRGLVKVQRGAKGVRSNVRCDALILDPQSRSDTYPYIEIDEGEVSVGHEATVQRIDDEQLFYMMTRGIPEVEAMKMIVNGFIEPIVKELPMEYAVEMNRLVELQMDDAIG